MPRPSPLQRVRQVGVAAPEWLKAPVRPLARRLQLAGRAGDWTELDTGRPVGQQGGVGAAVCCVCGWSGHEFMGVRHVESAVCPRCGSVARDRFLLWSASTRGLLVNGARVLETSPRMGNGYRQTMRRRFEYRASDYDLGSHRADIRVDLQDIDLPDGSFDVVLTAHVLEHVPDTARALSELHRVVAPGGAVYLQVPLLHGITAPPIEPEYHGDDTLVFWRFGWDLTDNLRTAGFDTSVLVTSEFAAILRGESPVPQPDGDIFDVADIVRHVRPADLQVVADEPLSARSGWLPSHQFVTWEARRR